MEVQEYLKQRLENCSKYIPTEEDKKIIQFEGIEEYIFRKLKSKKFRKTSIDEESEKQVRNAIHIRVEKKLPIRFAYPFGGYKLWRIPSHPNVDWAEFFVIAYVTEYISQILPLYEPGVELVFSSDDVCIELIDNYPREELDAYNKSFNYLLSEFRKYFPSNYTVALKQIYPDVYTKEEYEKEIKELYDVRKEAGFTEDQRKGMMQKMELHFRSNGARNYGEMSEDEKLKVWEDLTFWSDAYLKLTKRRAFVRAEDSIVLFSKKIPNAIDIGSTKASKSSFWAGIGVLEKGNSYFTEKILSPKQWEETKGNVKMENIELLEIDSLKSVPVYIEKLDFLNK